jgi:hypothetical protein
MLTAKRDANDLPKLMAEQRHVFRMASCHSASRASQPRYPKDDQAPAALNSPEIFPFSPPAPRACQPTIGKVQCQQAPRIPRRSGSGSVHEGTPDMWMMSLASRHDHLLVADDSAHDLRELPQISGHYVGEVG